MSDEYVLTQMHVFFFGKQKKDGFRKNNNNSGNLSLTIAAPGCSLKMPVRCQVCPFSSVRGSSVSTTLHVEQIFGYLSSQISQNSPNSAPVGSDCLHWVRKEKELCYCSWGPLFLSDHYDWKHVQFKYLNFIFCCVFLGGVEVDWLFPHSSTDQSMFMCIHWLV